MFIMNPYRFGDGMQGEVTAAIDFTPGQRVAQPGGGFKIRYNDAGDLTEGVFRDADFRYDSVNNMYFKKRYTEPTKVGIGPQFEFSADGDTTVECWVANPNPSSSAIAYLSTGRAMSASSRVGWIFFNWSNSTYLTLNDRNNDQIFAAGKPKSEFPANAPIHAALVKEGDIVRAFWDGKLVREDAYPNFDPGIVISSFEFGVYGYGSQGADVAKVRITQGAALYTKPFTPEIWR